MGALRLVADDYYASIGARQNVLSESVNGITTIKALARGADRILVLEAGRLVGDGPHEQLVKSVPEYASRWSDYARSLEGPRLDRGLGRGRYCSIAKLQWRDYPAHSGRGR
jgi:hypothetical protein